MLQKFSALIGRRLRPAPHVAAVARHNDFHWPNLAETHNHSLVYQQSPWVYVAVNRIAEAAALVPLRVLRLDGERRVEVRRHPLERLLNAPNPFLSRFELIEQTVGALELTGSAYWFLAGDGAPVEIWPLRPDRVSIVPDPARYIKGYVYELDGLRIPLEPAEVVHFKRWNPANDYYGLSALEAARLAVASDRAMAEWNRNTFGRDNGVPAGIVHIRELVSDADFERIKREWRQSYGGPQRRTAFLRGGGIEWQNIGLNHNDLDFLKGRQAHREEILNIFGVPVGLFSENATEANAKVAERLFIERTLWPKLVRIAQKITQELLPFWPGDTVAEFDDIRPTDTQARLDDIRAAYPVLSINEIRARYYQLPPVAWGALPVGAEKRNTEAQRLGDTEEKAEFNAKGQRSKDAEGPDADGAGQDKQSTQNSEPATFNSTKAALDEIARWERFTLKRWGREHRRAFEVRALPDAIALEISAGLLAADSEAAARDVFQTARETLTVQE
ncbi:MAG: phage portal protein [Chloroflexi bacterium]|nr:phage portal protein [Chloroflexota bacterium]